MGLVAVVHGSSCSEACGIFLDQGLNPCSLHWQADFYPLCHQGSPGAHIFLKSKHLWEKWRGQSRCHSSSSLGRDGPWIEKKKKNGKIILDLGFVPHVTYIGSCPQRKKQVHYSEEYQSHSKPSKFIWIPELLFPFLAVWGSLRLHLHPVNFLLLTFHSTSSHGFCADTCQPKPQLLLLAPKFSLS